MSTKAVRREAPVSEKTGERTRRFVLSDESVDRYNTTFKVEGWELENFERNPVVLWCHNSRSLPIGKASVSKTDAQLLAEVEFFDEATNPDAPRIMKMVDAGVLGVSVGARVLESEYNLDRESEDEWENIFNPPIDFTRAELLEMSVVAIPGNPNALPLREASLDELRLAHESLAFRSAAAPGKIDRKDVKALREAALARRATPAPEPEQPTMPAPVDPELEQLDVEGLDEAGLKQLVAETVSEAIADRSKSAALRKRGELEVA